MINLDFVPEYWPLQKPVTAEQINEDSVRLLFRITAGTKQYFLKGFPGETAETTVKSNTAAHLFLGNENGMAPALYPMRTGEYYVRQQGYWFYLMEFIEGRQMEETVDDEYRIGRLAKKLHDLNVGSYGFRSPLTQSKDRYYEWFREKPFVMEFDAVLDALPDFEALDQCFVHTDIGPHNTILREDGKVVFIDLDDAGIGSRYLDLGWPFIMQFVDFNHDTEEMTYRFDLAVSFLKGYYGSRRISREEYDLIFSGAEQMHISYMQTYGPDAVDSLWKILLFGREQKETLWRMISG